MSQGNRYRLATKALHAGTHSPQCRNRRYRRHKRWSEL